MRYPERALQRAVADYLQLCLLPPAFWTAIGHGGGGLIRGKILKGMGLKPGLPDLYLRNQGGETFWLELKARAGRLSPEQRAMHQMLRAFGDEVAVVRSLDEVRLQLKLWGFQTRETHHMVVATPPHQSVL